MESKLKIFQLARGLFTLVPMVVGPLCLIIDAPFGRFAPSSDSIFLVDGIKSWMVMEIVSPLTFLYTFLTSTLAPKGLPFSYFTTPQKVLASLWIIHYLNRAIISPLRTPSRSRSHVLVPLAAVIFNLVNGSLNGSYLSSPFARGYLSQNDPKRQALFWGGVGLWVVGFIGNVVHDEILLNIRRKAKVGKKDNDGKPNQEHYAIPTGLLYKFISYPNYFCEWAEWVGFAMAAAPIFYAPPSSLVSSLTSWNGLANLLCNFTPPWIFVINEVLLMWPRAYRGHQWYLNKFPDYPKERTAVIPFLC